MHVMAEKEYEDIIWRLSRETSRYKGLYLLAIVAMLVLTGVNLAAPRSLAVMIGIVESGVDGAGLRIIGYCFL